MNVRYERYKETYRRYRENHQDLLKKFNEYWNPINHSRYGFGGNRLEVLQRDNFKCVKCGMTSQEHMDKWDRQLTIDHIEGKGVWDSLGGRRNNIDNLQTLCCRCHGKKDRMKLGKK